MPLSPALWGASLCCALGGAFAGSSFGSAPVVGSTNDSAYVAGHPTGSPLNDTQEGVDLPDHYPLITRNGVVPVERLSDRGLYAQARYRSFYAPMDAAEPLRPVAYDEHQPIVSDAETPATTQPVIRTAAIADSGSKAVEPLALARPAVIPASGNAKIIKVEAALALN